MKLCTNVAYFLEKKSLFDKHFCNYPTQWTQAILRLLCASDYAANHIDIIQQLLQDDPELSAWTSKDYIDNVQKISLSSEQTAFSSALRLFRHYHLLRLLIREYAGFSNIEDTMLQWSFCADALILHAKTFAIAQCTEIYGTPLNDKKEPVDLYTLAMGKLGGQELNFSSDIDLIFTFSANGYTSSHTQSISNQAFYTKVIQQFLALLQTITKDGFVFRVDLRLRPNGNSGPLVLSFAAMEAYYQEQGRDWERYAMIKARLLENSPCATHWFARYILPFVYRRYLDYGVIDSLKTMKALIEQEIKRDAQLNDIKRGTGGIREIEFIVQNIQLIRGGRAPHIQQPHALTAIALLEEAGFINKASMLKKAYIFYRRLENVLQTAQDKQTHSLPTDKKQQAAVAIGMNMKTWEDVVRVLQRYQHMVSRLFKTMLYHSDENDTTLTTMTTQWMNVWQGHIEDNMAVNFLENMGFKEPEQAWQMLTAYRSSIKYKRMPQYARLRLDRLMGMILKALTQFNVPDQVLLHMLKLLEHIMGRSTYLALLLENPPVLHEVLHWLSVSPFITSLIETYPFLLEVFIDQNKSWKIPSLNELKNQLQKKLHLVKDIEEQDDILRQFKWTCTLLAARAEWHQEYDSITVSRFLTDVAEIIVVSLVEILLAEDKLCTQPLSLQSSTIETKDMSASCVHQEHSDTKSISNINAQFAIVAYGSLGARDMNYHSDVDLVFLHQLPHQHEHLVIRLTQKILHRLSTRTRFGQLYAVDTRLRPSGSAGLLISHINAYVDYQSHHAWTYEHQALLKARIIYANNTMKSLFFQLKKDVLICGHDNIQLFHDIQSMRHKIQQHIIHDQVKSAAGGLLDLEFLIHYLILSSGFADFYCHTEILAQVSALHQLKIISSADSQKMIQAYRHYQQALHHDILQKNTHPSPMIRICQEHIKKILQYHEIKQTL